MRWKIENEGFNNQKNSGYNVEHKFSRTNANAIKNYYQLLQIADLINQLASQMQFIKDFKKENGLTYKAIFEKIFIYLNAFVFEDIELINNILNFKVKLNY